MAERKIADANELLRVLNREVFNDAIGACPRCRSRDRKVRNFVQDDNDCRSWGACNNTWHNEFKAMNDVDALTQRIRELESERDNLEAQLSLARVFGVDCGENKDGTPCYEFFTTQEEAERRAAEVRGRRG